MRLSALYLHGFKSFREATRIRLTANPVVVVGPNGCGKSNIVDAVRWVLGESSARQLRGGAMGDLISNGAAGKSAASQAVVELLFDNQDAQAPAPWTDTAEIRVRRSLTRDGDAQYRINDARCRRRDVGDLFLGTGLGATAYAIIEQGTVGRIVDGRPDDLRALLEEAGGISRYKERRKETLQRVAETREHLQRLRDIHGEMEGQYQRLQRQAAAAQRLRALRHEERQWQWWELAERLATLDAQVQSLAAEQEAREAALVQRGAESQGLDEQLVAARSALEQHQEVLAKAQEAVYALQGEQGQVEQQWQSLQEQLQELARHLQDEQSRAAHWRQEQERRARQLHEADGQRAQLLQRQARRQDEEIQWRQARETAEQALKTAEQGQVDAQVRLADWRREAEVLQARLRELQPRLQALQRRLQELERVPAPDVAALRTLEAQTQKTRLEGEGLQQALPELLSKEQAAQQALEALREQRDQLQQVGQSLLARREALERLQRGLERPPRAEASAGVSLSQELQVQPPWEWVVEQVLGERLHARVLETANWAITGTGAWLFPDLTLSRPEWPPDALLWQLQAADPLLSALSPWFWGLRTTADLATAVAQRGQLGPGEAWITPSGELVFPQALLRLGEGAETGASLLQCRRELASLAEQQAAHDPQLALIREQTRLAESAWRESSAARQGQEQRLRQWETRFRQESEALARMQSRMEAEAQRQAERQQEALAVAAELADLQQRHQSLERDLQRQKAQEQGLRQREQVARTELQDCQRQQGDWRQRGARLRDEGQRLALELQRLDSETQASGERLRELATELAGQEERLQALLSRQAESTERLPVLEAQRATILARREAANQTLRQCQEAGQVLQKQLRERDAQRQALERERRALEDARLAASTQLASLEARRQEWWEQGKGLAAQLGSSPGPMPADERPPVALARIQAAIARLGNVNLAAEEELQDLEGRRGTLLGQVADVEAALESLEAAMAAMDAETASRFLQTLAQVNASLGTHFAVLFDGGQASLEASSDDPLEAGLILRAQPPGKRNGTLQQLSGGEKALTAIALIFALFQLNPAPFCILDEVDAPLDDANVGRFCALVRQLSARTQFLLVSHRHLTLQVAEQLLGVTMPEPGISRVVPVTVAETLQSLGPER